MSSVQLSSATMAHVIPPSAYRTAVLRRRISVSPEVAAVMVALAYGEPRDHHSALPAASLRGR